jgi:hypothetical protein
MVLRERTIWPSRARAASKVAGISRILSMLSKTRTNCFPLKSAFPKSADSVFALSHRGLSTRFARRGGRVSGEERTVRRMCSKRWRDVMHSRQLITVNGTFASLRTASVMEDFPVDGEPWTTRLEGNALVFLFVHGSQSEIANFDCKTHLQ